MRKDLDYIMIMRDTSTPKFKVNENYIMWGFRYALGRRTGAVLDVVTQLKNCWSDLHPFTQNQIKEEITTAINTDRAGDNCDIDSWREILKLNIDGTEVQIQGKEEKVNA